MSCCLEEVCGCKPWHVPAEDGTETCFVLGNVCFSQVIEKIRQKKVSDDIDMSRSMFKLRIDSAATKSSQVPPISTDQDCKSIPLCQSKSAIMDLGSKPDKH